MNILVTGATGLIGQNLIARLSTNREIKIWGLSRIRGTNPKVTYIEGDISNVNLYEKLSSQIDVFVHTAAQMKYGNPEEIKSTINTNIMGTARLYNFIKRHNPGAYSIFCSTISVYGSECSGAVGECYEKNPSTIYGLSKLIAEEIVSLSDTSSAILRLCSLYDDNGVSAKTQPLLYNWINSALENEDLIVHGNGTEVRQYLNIDDVIDLIQFFIENKCLGTYNVGPKVQLKLLDIARKIVSTTESSSKVVLDETKALTGVLNDLDISKLLSVYNFKPKKDLSYTAISYTNSKTSEPKDD